MKKTIHKVKLDAKEVFDLYQRTGVPFSEIIKMAIEESDRRGVKAMFYLGKASTSKKEYVDLRNKTHLIPD